MRELVAADMLPQALAEVDRELTRDPGNAELLHARGTVLVRWKRYREAYSCLLRAQGNGKTSAAQLIEVGWCAYLLGRHDEAEVHFRKAAELSPASADAHFALGVTLLSMGKFAPAIEGLRRVLALAPEYPDCALNIGACEKGLGNLVAAEASSMLAIDHDGRNARAWDQLGSVLAAQGRQVECLEAFDRAHGLEIEAGVELRSLAHHSGSLLGFGRAADARELCERWLPSYPDPAAHAIFAFALLTTGNFRLGWAQYEYRWFEEPLRQARAGYQVPVWSGQSLEGKTILLRSEQGFGDIIQFARFASQLKAMGATVILQAHPGIVELAVGFRDVDRVMARGEAFTRFDYYINLMSLPLVLGIEPDGIPAEVPYVKVDANRGEKWTRRLLGLPDCKVGVAWAGNPKHMRDQFRSVPLELLAAWWEVPGVHFVSLQKELRPGDAARLPTGSVLTDLGAELADFADTAAAILALDLVICVDTAIAHLAGALGKPVWLMLPAVADFRWMQDRADSPWYPTMRLFRQSAGEDWRPVVARIATELRGLAQAPANASAPPPSPGRCAIADYDASAANVVAGVVEMRYGIVQYLPDYDDAARAVVWLGEYAHVQLELLSQFIPMDAHVVEVGSGIGIHAIWLAKSLASEASVYLYEARPLPRQVLEQNLVANQVLGNVTLPRGALQVGGAAPAQTLDDLRLDRLDLLKIGLGAPAVETLEGAVESLQRLRPAVFAAVDGDATFDQVVRMLGNAGYQCWRVEVPLFDPRNFNRRDRDIFAGRKTLAVLALSDDQVTDGVLATLAKAGDAGRVAGWSLLPAPAGKTDARPRSLSKFFGRLRESITRPGVLVKGPDIVEREQTAESRALDLVASGRYVEARREFSRAFAAHSRSAQFLVQYGKACLHTGSIDDARALFAKAVAAEPESPVAHYELALADFQAGRLEIADEGFARAIALDPDNVDAMVQRAFCKLDRADPAAAETLARRAIVRNALRADGHCALGMALMQMQRTDEGLETLGFACRLQEESGEDGNLFINYAVMLAESGRACDAIAVYERNLPLRPDPYGYSTFAFALLRKGRFREGWAYHEFRWLASPFRPKRADFSLPEWNGQDLSGKRIVLISEQGAGDTLQFIRYAASVKALGVHVCVVAEPELAELLRSVNGVDYVPPLGETIPNVDFFIHVMGLPKVFGTSVESIPAAVPYVSVAADRIDPWKSRFAEVEGMKVGIVWAGNPAHRRDHQRSIALETLAPLAAVRGVSLYSLQKGKSADEARAQLREWRIEDLSSDLHTFTDTAAAIGALDLVISVDTSVAHLAGALGKPVWLLLPNYADFRWLEGRDDSPWYPTMRMFRQLRPGIWSDVVDRVAVALRGVAASGGTIGILPSAEVERSPEPATRETSPRETKGATSADFAAVAYTRHGRLIYLPSHVDEAVSLESYGEWSNAALELALQRVRPGAVVVEVAPGVGAHSIAIAKAIGSDGLLLLAEPRLTERRVLRRNLRANAPMNYTILEEQSAPKPWIDALELRALALLVVSDAGHAREAIAAASESLWRLRPAVMAQVGDASEAAALAEDLRTHGYRCWRHEAKLFDPANFSRRSVDLFTGRTSLTLVALAEEAHPPVALPGCVELT